MAPNPGPGADPLRRLLGYAGRQRGQWLGAIATMAVAMFLIQLAARLIPLLPLDPGSASRPTAFDLVLEQALGPLLPAAGAPDADVQRTYRLLALMVGLITVGTLILRQGRSVLTRLGQDLIVDLRTDYHAALMRQGPGFFRERETGLLTSVGLNDTETLSAFTVTHIPYFVQSGAQFLTVFLLMLTLDAGLTLATLGVIAVVFILTQLIFTPPTQRLAASYAAKFGDVTSRLAENIAGVRDIQVFVQEARLTRAFRGELEALAGDMRASARWQAWSFALYQFLESIGPVLIFGAGALLVLGGQLDDKILASFAAYFSQLALPVLGVSRSMVTLQSVLVAARRVFGVMDVAPEVRDRPGAVDPGLLRGHIRFENVTFSYAPDDPEAWKLYDVNLEFKPGEKVAIVGGSGSGKTTLLNLIARFQEATEGRVTIDGRDVRDLTLAGLRRNLGLVAQNVMLFRGTLRDNVRFARPDAGPEAVEAAARVGDVAEFVDKLEAGYDTPLGELGQGLSGGQKQRVSIARAALANPPILLLDEATSALDTRSEAAVMRALDRLMQGRTSVVIAHRLNTIRNADQIVLLGTDARGNGLVRAVGTHDRLMETSPEYAELYGRQRRKAILMPIGPLYDTTPALPTVIGLATAYKAPVFLLDFGPVKSTAADEFTDKRFGVSVLISGQDPRVINARHLYRVDEIKRKLKAEDIPLTIVPPPDDELDWVDVTLRVIAETDATHLVAVDNVMVPMEKLRESIRLIERKGGVEYILVNPIAALE